MQSAIELNATPFIPPVSGVEALRLEADLLKGRPPVGTEPLHPSRELRGQEGKENQAIVQQFVAKRGAFAWSALILSSGDGRGDLERLLLGQDQREGAPILGERESAPGRRGEGRTP